MLMLELALVDAEIDGEVVMVVIGLTGSSKRHRPSVLSLLTGAYCW
jgi:hypothetical protein